MRGRRALSSVASDGAARLADAETSIPAFKPIKALGFWSIRPIGRMRRQLSQVKATEVRSIVNTSEEASRPRELKIPPASSFPFLFRDDLPKQRYVNIFPHDPGSIVPIYVAMTRGVKLEDIDFVLGGSSLNTMVSQRIPKGDKILTQKVGNVIILRKHKPYAGDKADIGFQFERLVTGGAIADKDDLTVCENLHIMDIGGFKVLFSAEVDAIAYHSPNRVTCYPVEVKANIKKSQRRRELMWQMISSGSQMCVSAERKGLRLAGIEMTSLGSIVAERRHELERSV